MTRHEKIDLNSGGTAVEVVADLRLPERKAFELCAGVSSAIGLSRANPQEPALAEGLRRAHRLAENELMLRHDEVPLQEFLRESAAKVVATVEEEAENFPLSRAGRSFLASLRRMSIDAQLVPCEIQKYFRLSFKLAQDFYTEHLSMPYKFPKISLRIGVADAVNAAFPGRRVAFNASVRYRDEEPGTDKHTLVTVRVFPSSVEPGCMMALPYVVMHEVFCHWPQMLRSPGPRPNPPEVEDPFNKNATRSKVDPLSEGWMDGIIERLFRLSCHGAELSCLEHARTAAEIHGERIEPRRTPSFADAVLIAPGHEAAELVKWLFTIAPEAEENHQDADFLRLSSELNAADWGYEQRADGCLRLIEACTAYAIQRESGETPSATHSYILDALLNFRRSGDPLPLIRALVHE